MAHGSSLYQRSLEIVSQLSERCRRGGRPRDDENSQAAPGERFAQNRRHAAANGVSDDGPSDGLADRYADHRSRVMWERVGAVDGQGCGGDTPAALAQSVELPTAPQAGITAHQTVRR